MPPRGAGAGSDGPSTSTAAAPFTAFSLCRKRRPFLPFHASSFSHQIQHFLEMPRSLGIHRQSPGLGSLLSLSHGYQRSGCDGIAKVQERKPLHLWVSSAEWGNTHLPLTSTSSARIVHLSTLSPVPGQQAGSTLTGWTSGDPPPGASVPEAFDCWSDGGDRK